MRNIKKFFKERLFLAIGSIVFLLGGLVALLIGFQLSGWSIIDWLKSPYATTCFILIGVGVLIILVGFITYKRIHLGDDDYDE